MWHDILMFSGGLCVGIVIHGLLYMGRERERRNADYQFHAMLQAREDRDRNERNERELAKQVSKQ